MTLLPTTPTARTTALLAQAEREEPGKLAKAKLIGAQVYQFAAVDDYALVLSRGAPKALVVNWQGHRDAITGGGWPTDGISRWAPRLRDLSARGMSVAVAALQTHDGGDGYLDLAGLRARIEELRAAFGGVPVIYHGFSKGGSLAYAVAASGDVTGVVADACAFVPGAAANHGLDLAGRFIVSTSGVGDTTKGSTPAEIIAGRDALAALGAEVLPLSGGVGKPTDHGWWLGSAEHVYAGITWILGGKS